ncbi:MAG: hypothetical protein U1G07_19040 [Verrucomicrobiota bacterium]
MGAVTRSNLVIGGAFRQVTEIPRAGLAQILGANLVPRPVLTKAVYARAGFQVAIPTLLNASYWLESTEDLGRAWSEVRHLTGDGNWRLLTDPLSDGPQRFYRVRAE